jgi:ABC-type multidrug transport system fused ATPase/permease subunit
VSKKARVRSYVVRLIEQYRRYIVGILILAVLNAGINSSFGILLKWITDSLTQEGRPALLMFIAAFATQRFLLPLTGAAGMLVSNHLANSIERDIRAKSHNHLLSLGGMPSDEKNSGEYQRRIEIAISSVRGLLNGTLRTLLAIALEGIFIVLFCVGAAGSGAGISLLAFAIAYSALILWLTRRRLPIIKSIARADANCAGFMHDSFINAAADSADIRHTRERKYGNLLEILKNVQDANSRKLLSDSVASAFVCMFAAFAIPVYFFWSKDAEGGLIIMLTANLSQLIVQINMLGYSYRSILSAGVDITRIGEALHYDEAKKMVSIGFFENGEKGLIYEFRSFGGGASSFPDALPISGVIELKI